MTAFTNYVDYHQRSALKAHTTFIASLHKITINHNPTEEENPQPTPGPSKNVNCKDLAENCSQLTKDDDPDATSDFIGAFEMWFEAA